MQTITMEPLFLLLFHLNLGKLFQQILKYSLTLPSTIIQTIRFKHSVLLFCIHVTCLDVYSAYSLSMLYRPFMLLFFMYINRFFSFALFWFLQLQLICHVVCICQWPTRKLILLCGSLSTFYFGYVLLYFLSLFNWCNFSIPLMS